MRHVSRWLPWVFLGLTLTYTAVHWYGRVVPDTVTLKLEGQSRAFMDFDVYHTAARRVIEGRTVYEQTDIADDLPCIYEDPMEYIYTPLLALTMTPLATVTPCTAEWIWLVLNVTLCLVAVPLLVLGLGLPRTPWIWGLAIGLVGAPMATLETLSLGQVNFIVLVLMLGCVWLLRHDRMRPAAILLGLAACLKIIPVLLGVFAVRQGGRRALFWTGGATVLIIALSFLLAPKVSVGDYLAAVQTRTVGGMAMLNNSSWVAAMTRAYDPSPNVINWMSRLNMLLVGGVGLWAMWRCPAAAVSRWLPALSFALAVAFTPVFQAHHAVLLYPALLVLAVAAVQHPRWPWRLTKIALVVILAVLLNSRGLIPLREANTVIEHLLVKPAWAGLWGVIVWLAVEMRQDRVGVHG